MAEWCSINPDKGYLLEENCIGVREEKSLSGEANIFCLDTSWDHILLNMTISPSVTREILGLKHIVNELWIVEEWLFENNFNCGFNDQILFLNMLY